MTEKKKQLYRVWTDVAYRAHVMADSAEEAMRIASDEYLDWEECEEPGSGEVRDAEPVDSIDAL